MVLLAAPAGAADLVIDLASAMERVRGGQVVVSHGLLVEMDVDRKGPGELLRSAGPLDIRIRVKAPGWIRAERVALYVNGEMTREERIGGGPDGRLTWESAWHLPAPAHDVHLVAIATGPGIGAPYWPTAKPYQPTSIAFTPYVLGVSGAVFVDADADDRFDSAMDYARKEVTAEDDVPRLVSRLGRYDSAVAVQAASLLRAQDPAGFEARVRSMADTAPAQVARGLIAYLDAWRQTRISRAGR